MSDDAGRMSDEELRALWKSVTDQLDWHDHGSPQHLLAGMRAVEAAVRASISREDSAEGSAVRFAALAMDQTAEIASLRTQLAEQQSRPQVWVDSVLIDVRALMGELAEAQRRVEELMDGDAIARRNGQLDHAIARERAARLRAVEALRSIAANTCCNGSIFSRTGNCREAALVARAALASQGETDGPS